MLGSVIGDPAITRGNAAAAAVSISLLLILVIYSNTCVALGCFIFLRPHVDFPSGERERRQGGPG